jgi:hypothetical protein
MSFNERTGSSMSDGSDGGSLAFLVLGAMHAVPIFVVAALTKSKALTWLTAIGMAFVAVTFGSSSYAILDLAFVGLGLWISLGAIAEPRAEGLAALRKHKDDH